MRVSPPRWSPRWARHSGGEPQSRAGRGRHPNVVPRAAPACLDWKEMRNINATPRLTIGLPVYNGEKHIAEALDALLGQTFEDFELIISDNASTDGTEAICRQFEGQDSRIRYFRQPHNIGMAANHNFVAEQGRGELFKWASHDDLYARDLLRRCVEALDANPHIVLAHSWTAIIDSSGTVTKACEYPLDTASLRAPERFTSMLFDRGGDDYYGVVRASTLRKSLPQDSYHHADRTIVTRMSLYGPFYQVPDWLYFRRQHAEPAEQGGAERAWSNARARCANMDQRRANRLRHPAVRLYAEYVWAFVSAIQKTPLSSADRRECYAHLARWAASRAHLQSLPSEETQPRTKTRPSRPPNIVSVDDVVAGRERSAS
jgi:glycosyltransferase involved in cell wall biosynthesis